MSPLERAIAEQRSRAAYLLTNGPECEGAFMGLVDWMIEEHLIRLETHDGANTEDDD